MIDPDYFAGLRRRIDAVATCADLQDAALDASGLAKVQADIAARLAELQPVLALLKAPDANLVKIVTWISDFATAVLTPQVRPIVLYAQQLAELAAEATSIAQALEAKAAQIGDCQVSLPGLPLP